MRKSAYYSRNNSYSRSFNASNSELLHHLPISEPLAGQQRH